jgi:hypothetical protein
MRLSGVLATDLLWGCGRVPEFLKMFRHELRPLSGTEDARHHVLLKVKPVDDPFVQLGNLFVDVSQDDWARFLLVINGCNALRVLNTRSGPDMRLPNCVKWEVDVRFVTAIDQMELLAVADGLDDSMGVSCTPC